MPEMGLVTVFCPVTTTGAGKTAVQTADETRFVVDCKVNPVTLVGHVKTTFPPEGVIVSCGVMRLCGTDPLQVQGNLHWATKVPLHSAHKTIPGARSEILAGLTIFPAMVD